MQQHLHCNQGYQEENNEQETETQVLACDGSFVKIRRVGAGLHTE